MTTPASFMVLECRVGLGRLSIATDAIEVLGEYSVGNRLPLTERIGYSLGVWDNEVVMSLSMSRSDPAPSRTTAGLLLVTPGTSIRWAFEIGAPLGLAEVTGLESPQSEATRWLRTATLSRGGVVQFVDVHMLVAKLGDLEGVRASL
jgi:hypothetical protein